MGTVGTRDRWRLPTAATMASMPLRGFFVLAWSDHISVNEVAHGDRPRLLGQNLTIRVPPRDAAAFRRVTELPMWEVGRPQELESLPATLDALRGIVLAA